MYKDKDKQRHRQERIDFINTLPCPIDRPQVTTHEAEYCIEDPKEYKYVPRAGYLYIIQCKGFPYYKIGQTTMPKGRLNSLQTGCPFDLSIEYAMQVKDMNESERQIHIQYEGKRMRGEWFMLTDAELESVKEDMVIMKDYVYV